MASNTTWSLSNFVSIFPLQSGKFGEVSTGIDTRTGVRYVIKKISKKVEKTSSYVYANELNIHSQLDHPNIIKLYGHFEDETHNYMVMEYASLGDLTAHRLTLCKYNEKMTANVIRCVLNSVKYLHDKGIVHRDIKMENLLLMDNRTLKLCDFGLSELTSNIKTWYSNRLCGTIQYIAPEKFRDNTYSYMIDAWAIGCMAYELYCARSAFSCKTNSNTIHKIIYGNVKLPDTMSSTLTCFILRLLDKNPTTRMTIDEALKHPFIIDNQVTIQDGVVDMNTQLPTSSSSCDSDAATIHQESCDNVAQN
jgi:aurora kinase